MTSGGSRCLENTFYIFLNWLPDHIQWKQTHRHTDATENITSSANAGGNKHNAVKAIPFEKVVSELFPEYTEAFLKTCFRPRPPPLPFQTE